MIRSPLIILLELVIGLIQQIMNSSSFAFSKLIELFITLSFISGLSPVGFVLSMFIGLLVIFFILKLSFGSSKTLIILFLFFFILLFLVLLGVSSAQIPE